VQQVLDEHQLTVEAVTVRYSPMQSSEGTVVHRHEDQDSAEKRRVACEDGAASVGTGADSEGGTWHVVGGTPAKPRHGQLPEGRSKPSRIDEVCAAPSKQQITIPPPLPPPAAWPGQGSGNSWSSHRSSAGMKSALGASCRLRSDISGGIGHAAQRQQAPPHRNAPAAAAPAKCPAGTLAGQGAGVAKARPRGEPLQEPGTDRSRSPTKQFVAVSVLPADGVDLPRKDSQGKMEGCSHPSEIGSNQRSSEQGREDEDVVQVVHAYGNGGAADEEDPSRELAALQEALGALMRPQGGRRDTDASGAAV
jgi:hypothetical protein